MFRSSVRYTPDEFVERILCTVPGMLHKGNIFLMEKAIAEIDNQLPLLEIGSFCGQSAIILNYLLKKHQKSNKLICVDPFLYEGWQDDERKNDFTYLNSVGGNTAIKRTDYLDFVKTSFRFHTEFFLKDQAPQLFELSSDEYFAKNAAERYAFVFVDGGHSFEQCKRDVTHAGRGLKPDAYLLLDDSEKGSKLGSAVFASALKKESGFEIADRNPHCLLRKI